MRTRVVDKMDQSHTAPAGSPENRTRLLLVDSGAVPEVFVRVVEAKRYLQSGEADTAAEAARMAGISRSAYYKYKEAVFPYDEERTGHILTVHLLLRDRPGMLSAVLTAFAEAGANILTVNQNIPAGGTAARFHFRPDRPHGPAGRGFYPAAARSGRRAAYRTDFRRRSGMIPCSFVFYDFCTERKEKS